MRPILWGSPSVKWLDFLCSEFFEKNQPATSWLVNVSNVLLPVTIIDFMDILIYLIPITVLISAIGLTAFIWSLKNKQYEDLEGSANRILFDEEED